MFACCCGVGALPMLLKKSKKDEIVDCWRYGVSATDNSVGQYIVPKTGYWALSISSHGSDVNEAQNIATGTAYYVGKFTKGEAINYTLGNTNTPTSQASFRSVRLDTKEQGSGNQQASFLMRWIGYDFGLYPAKLVSVNNVREQDPGVYSYCNVFDDGTDVFAFNGNQIFTPSTGDWAHMTANKAHWYLQDVTLRQRGTYQVYVLGDDQQRLALNGVPVVWSDNSFKDANSLPNDCNLRRKQGTFEITAAGLYQLLVMQVNVPNNTPSWIAVVIKQPDGTTLNLINNWKYIETTFDCDNKYIVPIV